MDFEIKLNIQEQAYDIGLMSTLGKKLFKSEPLFEQCIPEYGIKKQRIQQQKQYYHDYYAKKKK